MINDAEFSTDRSFQDAVFCCVAVWLLLPSPCYDNFAGLVVPGVFESRAFHSFSDDH